MRWAPVVVKRFNNDVGSLRNSKHQQHLGWLLAQWKELTPETCSEMVVVNHVQSEMVSDLVDFNKNKIKTVLSRWVR